MTTNQIIAKGKEVIKIEAAAIEKLVDSIDQNFIKAVDLILNSSGRVVFTGMGKSGLIARKIVATLNFYRYGSHYLCIQLTHFMAIWVWFARKTL